MKQSRLVKTVSYNKIKAPDIGELKIDRIG
jgi:hypothetical protein